MASQQPPPPYSDALTSQLQKHISYRGPCHLILKGCNVVRGNSPHQIMFEVTHPPCDANNTIYGVRKYKPSLAGFSGEEKEKIEPSHIYDFREPDYVQTPRNPVVIESKCGEQDSFTVVTMSCGLLGWSSCAAKNHFRASTVDGNRIYWEDMEGARVAEELPLRRGSDGENLEDFSQLVTEQSLEEKDFDLLVTCWLARVWKESQKASHSWKKDLKSKLGVSSKRDAEEIAESKKETKVPQETVGKKIDKAVLAAFDSIRFQW
ncbi:hypothetical protein HJFPF1_06121 [Paramyrothecium foliicola]|nr:hypothetical protein HJFPF1_06121 [Paramyrothecium foliicola]